jgi:hypothetical protein
VQGLHFAVSEREDGWGWDRIEREATAMPAPEENVVRTTMRPEPVVPRPIVQARAEAPRASTLADRKRIREYLEEHYDEDNARWRGDLSDRKAGEALLVPLAWVTRVREEIFGPDDVNEAQAQAAEADTQTLKKLVDLEGLVQEALTEVAKLRAEVEGRHR